jgi:hypothetical protein
VFDPAQIKEINSLDTNFRSDVIAACLVDSGMDADGIIVRRSDGIVRETDKEVSGIGVEYREDAKGNGKDILFVRTNRKGMYDTLPEGLFHDPSSLKDTGKEAVIHSFKRQKAEETFARKFFSPYESELDGMRVDMQLAEYRYDRPDRYRVFADTMSRLWPTIRLMDALTATLFLRAVPYIALVRGNYAQTAQAISTITGYEVRIEDKTRILAPKARYTRLNVMKLGVNSVLKGSIPIHYAKVSVTAPRADLANVLPGQRQHSVLQALLDTFMPNEVDCEIVIKPRTEDYTSRLGDSSLPCILGVNARLKSKNEKYESKKQ